MTCGWWMLSNLGFWKPQLSPPAAAAIDMAGLPLPPHFVGRKAELRSLRHALREPQVTAAFVRAIGGMGKGTARPPS